MSYSIDSTKDHLIGLTHSGTLNKIRNINELFKRAANNMLAKVKPLEIIRLGTLQSTVYDKLYNYALPSDFYSLIDIYPQAQRTSLDQGTRSYIENFDRRKAIDKNQISIEGDGASKIIRINWPIRSSKVLNTLDSLTGNGTWAAAGTATNVALDTIFKYSGGGSIKFDQVASGDGIQNSSMEGLDLTDEDEIADVIVPFYIKDSTELAKLTSATVVWGNDLTTAYWTGVAQTAQADGTAFRVGWNIIKVPWNTATETGTVTPSTIDSVKITFVSSAPIADIRVDNILFSIGYPFDIKYYSRFLFSTSAGARISQPTSGSDLVILDDDSYNIYLYECLDEAAHQMEGEDSRFDMEQASKKLWGDPRALDNAGRVGLYAAYKNKYPDQSKKIITSYGLAPRFNR